MPPANDFVTYEMFGATGDGVTDDLPAIQKAHEHANAQGLSVRSRPDADYHLGSRALTVYIETDTDWNTSRFIVDDTAVEDNKAAIFWVRSSHAPLDLPITSLRRDQKQLDVKPERDCYVRVENDQQLRYRRRGLNQSDGEPQQDCFILRTDGSIEGDIDWDYDAFTTLEICPIDEQALTVRGGVFTTIANRMYHPIDYNYWGRNIEICRSNTEIVGVTHYVVGETKFGQPYRGFINAKNCANVTFRDCFVTGHKMYSTIGVTGKPVNMGSYDMHANSIVNFRAINCRMNLICDATRWGVFATNFCKNILLEDCELSRMDTHMGVAGHYTIRNCKLGHMGVNAIGRGKLTLENCTIYGPHLISFRTDYGSVWDGDVEVRNCHWTPACGKVAQPYIFGVINDGMHDFGYPCTMPRKVMIDGLFIDDRNHPDDYEGPYIFNDPDTFTPDAELPTERPHPYAVCESLNIRNLTTATGKAYSISPNALLSDQIELVK